MTNELKLKKGAKLFLAKIKFIHFLKGASDEIEA